MAPPENPFEIAAGKITPDTRDERVKRHGLDPKDTAYTSHKYGPPIGMPPPLNPEFVAAQRRIEAIFPGFRADHPELEVRQAWIAAGRSIGIEIEAIAVYA